MVAWVLIASLALSAAAPQNESPPLDAPSALGNARRLVEELRFEEAVVEYQRYLSQGVHPVAEKARALVELGFVHSVLGDEPSAKARAMEGLELDPGVTFSADAPAKQLRFLASMREEQARKVTLDLTPRDPETPPEVVRVKVVDRTARVSKVVLRHAVSYGGPFYSAPMKCAESLCQGQIPPLSQEGSYTAWYFVEAVDVAGSVLARVSSPSHPLEGPVIRRRTWYKNPWVWGGTAAVLLTAGAVVFLASPAPPAR